RHPLRRLPYLGHGIPIWPSQEGRTLGSGAPDGDTRERHRPPRLRRGESLGSHVQPGGSHRPGRRWPPRHEVERERAHWSLDRRLRRAADADLERGLLRHQPLESLRHDPDRSGRAPARRRDRHLQRRPSLLACPAQRRPDREVLRRMSRAARGATIFALVLAAVLAGGAGTALLGICGPFTYVSDPSFCNFVIEIFVLGITTGTTPTTFDPAAPVSRLQMAALLSRTVDATLARGGRPAAPAPPLGTQGGQNLRLAVGRSGPAAVRSPPSDL